MSQESSNEKVIISSQISEDQDIAEYMYLLKDENTDEYYLIKTLSGWKQISEIEKAFDILLKHKYYVKEFVVPLVYFILATNPKQFNNIFEFLYQNSYISIEEDEQ